MKTMMVALALALVALPTARPAFAKKYDEFQLKELRAERAQRKADKEAVERDEEEEQLEKAAAHHAHARARAEDGDDLNSGGDVDGGVDGAD